MKLCLEYYSIKLIGQQKIFIIKVQYIKCTELSKLFGLPKDTQYKNLSTGDIISINSLVLLDPKKNIFEIHDHGSGG